MAKTRQKRRSFVLGSQASTLRPMPGPQGRPGRASTHYGFAESWFEDERFQAQIDQLCAKILEENVKGRKS